jgi:hypothetical protein
MQLGLDIIYLQSHFTGQQIVGAGIIFLANSVSWFIKARKAFGQKKKQSGAKS